MLLKLKESRPLCCFLSDFEKAGKASERTIDNITKEDGIWGGGRVRVRVVSFTVPIRFSGNTKRKE